MTPRQSCFHCGEPLPAGEPLTVTIDGVAQPMCCPGCAAVAGLIADSHMSGFYRQRTAYSTRPAEPPADLQAEFRLFDEAGLREQFTEGLPDGDESARFLIGGMTCAACTWLIEHSLAGLPGVKDAQVQLEQQRLDLRYDPALIQPSQLASRVEALGYSVRPFQRSAQRELIDSEFRQDLRRVAVAGIGMMQVGMFGIALHAGDMQGIAAEHQALLRGVSLLVASFVVLYSARPFFTTAWRHLRQGALVMDLPVALAIGLAWLASIWATLRGSGEVYFDSVVMFTFFLLLGRFLEKRVRRRHAIACDSAEAALPLTVTVQREDQWQRLPRRQLRAGDRVRVMPGETIAVDGQVYRGSSAVREDSFNGEPLPRAVAPGAAVYAGTLNLENRLEIRVEAVYEQSRLAALQHSVERARRVKPRLARLADRIAGRFVAAILLITAATALAWLNLDPARALWVSLSVLVISCPCALALATPAALTAAANALRRRAVLVHGENALEALAHVDWLVFDKTGTLTVGDLRLREVRPLADLADDALTGLAAALQQYSAHPAAAAFPAAPGQPAFEQARAIPGCGVEGLHAGVRYRIGSETFCREIAPDLPAPPDDGLYRFALCRDQQALAWFGLDDSLREETRDILQAARQRGLKLALLSGDSSPGGRRLAESLGFDQVCLGLSPAQKLAEVQRWQTGGEQVAAVGDGLNDAPLLGAADASFAVANAADLARAEADLVIERGNLGAVIDSLDMAARCRRIMRQNIAWAIGYNACGIPLAALGFVPPWLAALGMSASSLLVVLNSLRLNRKAR